MSDGGLPRPAKPFDSNREARARREYAAGPPNRKQKHHEQLVHERSDHITIEWLIKIGRTQLSRLNRDDLEKLRPLLGRHVTKANRSLRGGEDEYELLPLTQQFLKAGMDPFIGDQVILFRGIDASDAFAAGATGEAALLNWLAPEAQEPDLHITKDYWFASTSHKVAGDYATTVWKENIWAVLGNDLHPVIFELAVRWGLFIPHLRHLDTNEELFIKTFEMDSSHVYDECQMVFPPGTRWKVLKILSDATIGTNGGHRIWMKQLDPPEELTPSMAPSPETTRGARKKGLIRWSKHWKKLP